MPQFLFVVEIPPSKALSSSPGYSHEWIQFENESNTILKPVTACKRLQQNVWLLPAENLWPVLMSMAAAAEKHHLACSVLLVDGVTDLTGKSSPGMQRIPVGGI